MVVVNSEAGGRTGFDEGTTRYGQVRGMTRRLRTLVVPLRTLVVPVRTLSDLYLDEIFAPDHSALVGLVHRSAVSAKGDHQLNLNTSCISRPPGSNVTFGSWYDCVTR